MHYEHLQYAAQTVSGPTIFKYETTKERLTLCVCTAAANSLHLYFFYDSLGFILSLNSLCMLFCCRFLHRHMAIKASRMSTITPKTQPTIRYSSPPGGLGGSCGWGPGGVMGCWLGDPGDWRAAAEREEGGMRNSFLPASNKEKITHCKMQTIVAGLVKLGTFMLCNYGDRTRH